MATPREKYPILFKPAANDNNHDGKRTVPMQVLNMSFPRTGTMSMQTALTTLGYTCYHSLETFSSPSTCTSWTSALSAKFFHTGPPFTPADWDRLLGSYSGISADAPAVCFAEELIAAYPDAKVILVHRDVEAWYRSFDASIITIMWSPVWRFAAWADPGWLGRVNGMHRRWAEGWMGARGKAEMRGRARGKFVEHYELVRRVTPRERLLEMELGEGWGPLCGFLGKEVPGVPFPRVNDSVAVWEMVAVVVRRALCRAVVRALVFGAPVVVLVAAVWLWVDEGSWWRLRYG